MAHTLAHVDIKIVYCDNTMLGKSLIKVAEVAYLNPQCIFYAYAKKFIVDNLSTTHLHTIASSV